MANQMASKKKCQRCFAEKPMGEFKDRGRSGRYCLVCREILIEEERIRFAARRAMVGSPDIMAADVQAILASERPAPLDPSIVKALEKTASPNDANEPTPDKPKRKKRVKHRKKQPRDALCELAQEISDSAEAILRPPEYVKLRYSELNRLRRQYLHGVIDEAP